MNGYKKAYKLRTKYDIDNILETIECHKNNPNYGSYVEQMNKLIETTIDCMIPMGYVVEDTTNKYLPTSCLKSLYCMVSLGDTIDQVINTCFANHEYLEGMMVNALADQVLFEATNHLFEILNEEQSEKALHLTIRYEPGNVDIPMSVQKDIFDKIMAKFNLDMMITEGYMLSPTKSLTYLYGISKEDCSMGLDHDCSSCDSIKCPHRKYVIKVYKNDNLEVIQAKKGENLLEVLRKHNVYINAPCSGKRLCGKCKITAKNHGYEMSEDELKYFSTSEEVEDMILACYHIVDRDLNIYIKTEDGHQEIESGYLPFKIKEAKYDKTDYMKETYPIGIGVDIGTTTLAVSLINLVTQEVIGIKKRMNPQKAYGADVISRIMYVCQNKDQQLGMLIKDVIEEMTQTLISEKGYNSHPIEEMVISGNTTMIYLFLEMNPEALAVSPFTTVDMGLKACDSKELFKELDSFKVTILPWISAYVGGDIVSGLFATHLMDKSENIVFVDIGTNGEMVLCTKDRFISAATAAGPAFEGANIKCGMGSIGGAICEIKQAGKGYAVTTLGGVDPIGICGSALIDAISLLHKEGYIDDMGFMSEPFMIYGSIGIYPEDVRQVQLAKAAIMAGVDVLLDKTGLTYDDIDAFYIAGGFGSHLNIENSAYIGLFPNEIIDKVTVVGNSSLAGSIRYLLEANGHNEVEAIRIKCEYVELSTNMKFNEAYIMGMNFGGAKG